MEPDLSALLTIKQLVEERPWLTERWLRRVVFDKKVPYYKVGGMILFNLDEFDQYVTQQRVEAKVSARPTKTIPRRRPRKDA